MNDPLGLINLSAANRQAPMTPRSNTGAPNQSGPGFKEMLQQQIDKVNQLQLDANTAMEDLATGRRDDLESVITATQKADLAFRMLLQVRNKMMDAYEEVKQIRI
jgi:flagellar hook-basal body complex protein FliE